MSLCILVFAASFCSLFGLRQQTHSIAPLSKGKLSIPRSVTNQSHPGLSFLWGGGDERGGDREMGG